MLCFCSGPLWFNKRFSLALADSVMSDCHELSALFRHNDLIGFTHLFCNVSLIGFGNFYASQTIILKCFPTFKLRVPVKSI